MNKFVALVDIGEVELVPMTVRVKNESEVEKAVKRKGCVFNKIVKVLPIAEFNKMKSKWIQHDKFY